MASFPLGWIPALPCVRRLSGTMLTFVYVLAICLSCVDGQDSTTNSTDPPVMLTFVGDARDDSSWSYLDKEIAWGGGSIRSFSFCFSFSITSVSDNDVIPILSYSVDGSFAELQIVIHWRSSELEIKCCNFKVSKTIRLLSPLALMNWESLCISVHLNRNTINIAQRGVHETKTENLDVPNGGEPSIRDEGLMMIGRLQHQHNGGLTDSLRGSIAQFLFFTRYLERQSILDITKEQVCTTGVWSTLFDSNLSSFSLKSTPVIKKEIDLQVICQSKLWYLMLPGRFAKDEARNICHHLHGNLVFPTSSVNETSQELEKHFDTMKGQCTTAYGTWLWLNAIHVLENGNWTLYSQRPRHHYNQVTQCLSLSITDPAGFLNTPCEENLCVVCQVHSRPSLTLRGGRHDVTERLFTFTYDSENLPKLRNNNGTELYWGSDGGENWYLRFLDSDDNTAWLENTADIINTTLPIGKRTWIFRNGSEYSTDDMVLSVCDDHLFACHNGLHCLHWTARCDSKYDCLDHSDEEGCQNDFLDLASTNSDQIPPLGADGKLTMLMNVHFMEMEGMDQYDSVQKCALSFTLEWFDPGLTMLNLHNFKKIISSDSLVWMPDMGGAVSEEAATLMTQREKPTLAISKSDDSVDGNLHTQDVEYSGSSNALQLYASYWFEYPCVPDLWYFPFDGHLCHFTLTFKNLGAVPLRITTNTSKELMHVLKQTPGSYEVLEVSTESHHVDGYPAITFSLQMLYNHKMTVAMTYFPSFVVLLVMYSVFFFPLRKTTARVLVSLACLAAVVVIFWVAVSEDFIPRSFSRTYMQLWFLFVFVFGFLVLLTLLAISCYVRGNNGFLARKWSATSKVVKFGNEEEDEYNMARQINLAAAIMYGLALVVIVLWYFIVAAIQVNKY